MIEDYSDRNIGLGASVTDGLDQYPGVIAFVSNHLFGGHIRNEGGRCNDVVDLSRRQPPSRRVTAGID